MILPLNNCKITSKYGIVRKDGKIHKGVDFISTSKDTEVKSIRKGTVTFVGYDPTGFGNYVVILQEDGFKALYCHLKKYSVNVSDNVKEGQIIGVEGDTGNSTGVHLHLELREAPYGREDHINVAEYLGINNEIGMVTYIQNYELLEYLGIMDYWRQGYKGQGMTVASIEDLDRAHGKQVADILKQILPEATILTGIKYYKDEIPDNLDGYTCSVDPDFSDKPNRVEKARELYSKGVFMTAAVGNDSYEGCTHFAKYDEWISVGACHLKDGKPKKAVYSSVTEYIDFMSFTYWDTEYGKFNGSSCATPAFQGTSMLVQQFFKENLGRKLTNIELIEFIKDNCEDLETEGHDSKTGYGLFILPKPWEIDFTKYLTKEEEEMPKYNTLEEVPEWGKATIEKLMNLGVLKGNENGELNLSYDFLRTLVIHDRLGLYD